MLVGWQTTNEPYCRTWECRTCGSIVRDGAGSPREDEIVANEDLLVELSMDELREVAAFATACAEPVLAIFERHCAGDTRARSALDEALRFASGGNRTKALRMTAFAAHRAARSAQEGGLEAAVDAARAAGHAGGAAYLHPLAKSTQVKHILGAAAHAARALELDAGDDYTVGDGYIEKAGSLASPTVVSVLTRYPRAPGGGGRVGELMRALDTRLRGLQTCR
ncbi:Exonuclease SbcC [Hoyosella subflava DQS3-9A1]|uniref:Exonuclease SbcC n=1 Tax=Hoyosella subflava (strain DSM 45089 / JCM 17490 / NBRC 109087 / DQS3-9A1) TaxID=443218 RepID=F6EQP5_HOYSD|nr:Exonuclease SbcC [Hoyosella subflava DQS3-9A1]